MEDRLRGETENVIVEASVVCRRGTARRGTRRKWVRRGGVGGVVGRGTGCGEGSHPARGAHAHMAAATSAATTAPAPAAAADSAEPVLLPAAGEVWGCVSGAWVALPSGPPGVGLAWVWFCSVWGEAGDAWGCGVPALPPFELGGAFVWFCPAAPASPPV